MPRKRSDFAPAKTSINLDAPTLAILDARAGEHWDRSSVIRALLGWYAEVVRREMPPLEEAEKNLIRDALNGTHLMIDASGVGMVAAGLPHEVADACTYNDLGAKWGVDGRELVECLDSMTFAQRLAVIDDVLQFWARV